MKKTAILLIVLMLSINFSGILSGQPEERLQQTLTKSISFQQPQLIEEEGFYYISLPDTEDYLCNEGFPLLPQYSVTYELPFGSTNIDIAISESDTKTTVLDKKIIVSPVAQLTGSAEISPSQRVQGSIYTTDITYPQQPYMLKVGAGLNSENQHVTYATVTLYPIAYNAAQDMLISSQSLDFQLTYTPPKQDLITAKNSDSTLLIIAPQEYANELEVLKDHKETNCSLPTTITTIEDILSSDVTGRDDAETIKYYTHDMIKNHGTLYILLVGDIHQLPIRRTPAGWWTSYEPLLLSDMYYSDVFSSDGSFCSWDANDNGIYGEVDYRNNYYGGLPETDNIDQVDLYSDAHIGRLPCSTAEEVQLQIQRIITYENEAYDQLWFHKAILCGGDTFPLCKFSRPFVYEGEITNTKVSQYLTDFDITYLWTSNHDLNWRSFNKALNKGAGFLSYAGHGFEHGWGTYKPNAITELGMYWYYTPYLKFVRNQEQKPVTFFDACLTAKLDFNISDFQGYYPLLTAIYNLITLNKYGQDDYFNCFAWALTKHETGGSIATIGATRSAYTRVDSQGVYGGAGYLDVEFFHAYNEGVRVGEMLTYAQTAYANNVGLDFFTLEEYVLIGDPSLMVGGYHIY